ncbi:MAG TPA: hypothetical protein VGD01_15000 [Candidatus Elarobacter sp.]|jgi:hypothetical protein
MDFLNRALEQAKQLQRIAAEAAQKGIEQATPLVQEGVAKAHELQQTIISQTPNMTAAAQQQANAAMEHAGAFIATGKTVLEAGASQAQQHLTLFAEQAKKAADATLSAVQSATQKPGEAAGQAPPSPPPPGPPPGAGAGPGATQP